MTMESTVRQGRQTASLGPLLSFGDFPMTPGHAWTYHCTSVAKSDITTRLETQEGEIVLEVGAELKLSHWVMTDGHKEWFETAYRLLSQGLADAQGNLLLPFPVHVGDTWQWQTDTGDLHLFSVHGPEPVTVPAGHYDALRVDEKVTQDGRLLVERQDWYVAGIGRIRSRLVHHNSVGTFEETRDLIESCPAAD